MKADSRCGENTEMIQQLVQMQANTEERREGRMPSSEGG